MQAKVVTTVGRVDSDEVLKLIRDVADEVVNPRFRALADHQVPEKNPGDLVTIADHEAEELLTRALTAAYPDAVVLGEEAHAVNPDLMTRYAAAEHAFTVDPVDGDQELRERVPRPRGDGRRDPQRRGGPGLDLAAPARAGVRRGARAPARGSTASGWCRRSGRRTRARGGASPRGGPGSAAALGDLRAAGADLGLLRGRLPEADRGRGRLHRLRPAEPVGPRPGLAAADRGGRVRRHRSTGRRTTRARFRTAAWSSPPTGVYDTVVAASADPPILAGQRDFRQLRAGHGQTWASSTTRSWRSDVARVSLAASTAITVITEAIAT